MFYLAAGRISTFRTKIASVFTFLLTFLVLFAFFCIALLAFFLRPFILTRGWCRGCCRRCCRGGSSITDIFKFKPSIASIYSIEVDFKRTSFRQSIWNGGSTECFTNRSIRDGQTLINTTKIETRVYCCSPH